ncbi:hypothetical protein ETD83_39700 [Actinomadura soli]|uniref:Uncharacterized protein n=1 Tax=Actinomadura soli TaxID=2508997 RepID=A0A5C4J241_9ACTN|nr:hypothetical protein ETD83_39700 [Actinomadura soli]
MTNPTTNLMTLPFAVIGPQPIPAGPTHATPATTDVTTGGAAGCSNCGSVHSVRVLPDGRHRCACGHRWTPTARPTTGAPADGTP